MSGAFGGGRRKGRHVILESIVTSVDETGQVNIAPMGPRVLGQVQRDDSRPPKFLLRPFNTSRTYRNLLATGKAVIHVTDDALLFARAAVDAIDRDATQQLVQQIPDTNWWTLRDCHRWFAVEIESVSQEQPRVDMECRVEQSCDVRPFFGFNRAKHAVIEAAILATRVGLLRPDQILEDLDRLQPLVDKTGGPDEHTAFKFLRQTIDDQLASQ